MDAVLDRTPEVIFGITAAGNEKGSQPDREGPV
jgi:hypothetical protein